MKCIDTRKMAAYVAGTLSDERGREIGAHVEACPACAELRRSFVSLTQQVRLDDTEIPQEDLVNDVLSLVQSGRAERQRFPVPVAPSRWGLRPRWWLVPAFGLPVMAGLLFAVGGTGKYKPNDEDTTGFRARGAAKERTDRWISLDIFRARAGEYEPVQESIATDDALTFSYRDRSSPAFTHLLLFAIDDSAQVHWYYPASAEDKAASITLTGNAAADLPDQVRYHLGQGSLRMFAIFSREPLQALSVQNLAQAELKRLRSAAALGRLPLPGTGQHTRLLVVTAKDGAVP